LIFVVLITALVMIVVTTSVVLSASNVRPSRETADSQAALAAAQAGTDLFAVALKSCGEVFVGCTAIAMPITKSLPGADGVVRATYKWQKLSDPSSNPLGVLRIEVTGQVRVATRSLITDFRPTPSFLDYLYFTERETVAAATIATYEGPRVVPLPTATIRAKATKINPALTSVTWSGAQGTAICEQPWYDLPTGDGRSRLRAVGALPLGMDYQEATTSPVGVQRSAACEVAFGSSTTMAGKVYSKDAFYLTNSVAGGQGPMFTDDIITEWTPSKNPAPATPGRWFRSNAQVGGDPRTGSEFPQLALGEMSMPDAISDLETTATCVFTGPTRIQLAGTEAVVTSPNTTAAGLKPGCIPTSSSGLIGTGLVQTRFTLGPSTVFYVRDGGVQAPVGAANPLFDLKSYAVTAEPPGAGAARFYTETTTTAAQLQAAAVGGDQALTVQQRVNTYLGTVNCVLLCVGKPLYSVLAQTGTAISPDPLLETSAQAVIVQRRVCTIFLAGLCTVGTPLTNEFRVTVGRSKFPMAADVTPYTTGLGSAFVEGTVQRPLTIASARDLVVSGNMTYTSQTAILGLVADGNVQLYHPVSCRTITPVTLPGRTCPDDITGLYSGGFTGSEFDAYHPSRRYLNLRSDLAALHIDGAVLARQGSLLLQNYMRGPALGTFTLTGGAYQRHRGATGVDWEAGADSAVRDRSGYVTSMTYDARLRASPPPSFVKPTQAIGSGDWQLVGTAERVVGG
jgi:hypothetical protein